MERSEQVSFIKIRRFCWVEFCNNSTSNVESKDVYDLMSEEGGFEACISQADIDFKNNVNEKMINMEIIMMETKLL